MRTIQSNKIDISSNEWIIFNPSITINNKTENIDGVVKYCTETSEYTNRKKTIINIILVVNL